MHKIAFIIGDRFVYWSPIIVSFGVLAAVCMFLALYMGHTGKVTGAFAAVPLALAFSLVLGRLVYWCCVPDSYGSVLQAFTDFSTEGIALTGIAAGCVLAACLVRLMGLSKNLPAMLDSMSLAGLFGLAVGRLNHLFNNTDRAFDPIHLEGKLEEIWPPLFLIQAVVSGVLFALLLVFFLTAGRKKPGDTCLLFCLFYGASQIVLEGMRYDALFLPGVRFASLSQLVGVAMMLLAMVLFSVRLVRSRGWKWWYISFWVAIAGLLTAAGIMWAGEADRFCLATTLCLVAAAIIAVVIQGLSFCKKQKERVE